MNIQTIFKSIWAVVAGAFAGALLSVGTDILLEGFHVFPSIGNGLFIPWMLALALFYRGVYTILGGYITAKLAPHRPMRHVLILGTIGTIVTIIGTIAAWDLSDHWYPIGLVLITLPCVWLGAKLYERRSTS